jgi:hypothetical protein
MKAATYHGQPCVACGGTERYINTGKCIPCQKARVKAWSAANPRTSQSLERSESRKAILKRWRQANPERYKAIKRASYHRTKARRIAHLIESEIAGVTE